MALPGLALWLRLARDRPAAWRVLAVAAYAPLVWLCQSFGWAMLGLFCFGAEWARVRPERGAVGGAVRAALLCLPMAAPVALMLGGRGDALVGETGDWFRWDVKAVWLVSVLRERWVIWDLAGMVALLKVVAVAARSPRLRFEPLLGIPALLAGLAFLLLPRIFQGGAYVDMRLAPYALALALLAIRGEGFDARRLALAGAAFATARAVGTTIAFAITAQGQAEAAAAILTLPEGGAVLVLVDEPAGNSWSTRHFTHLPGLAVARRRIFTNEQWALPGQQLVHPRHPRAAPFDRDPSHLVFPAGLEPGGTVLADAIRRFDRCTFGHVRTLGLPPDRIRAPDLVPV